MSEKASESTREKEQKQEKGKQTVTETEKEKSSKSLITQTKSAGPSKFSKRKISTSLEKNEESGKRTKPDCETVPVERMELPLNLFKSIILNNISKEEDDTNSIQLDNILDWFKNFVSTLSSSALQNIKIMINEAKDKFDNKGYRVPLDNFTILMKNIYYSIVAFS
ncbi:hypothetical protein CRE_09298 [Caenorhabditis remanei]|uniref:Uncharacterized protein n=1 Tax=Caenorhabditis remanei TaxID=31234 RepID=E3LI21_CAERE|nr:hypothetical protein CRE_09298 [Caenorhabditis remanei]